MENIGIKIDKKDRKILAMLERDARTPASVIAKSVGLSKTSVGQRIAALAAAGVIDQFFTHLNVKALDRVNYRLYLKFADAPPDFEQELARFLYARGNVRWFALCQGEWDFVLRTMDEDVYAFRRFEEELLGKFGAHIGSRAFCVIVDDAYHFFTQVTGNEGYNSHPEKDYAGGLVKLAALDEKILFWLFENSRRSAREIAQKTGARPDVVSYHIRKLEADGVVTGYSTKINRARLGFNGVKVLFWFRRETPKKIAAFRQYCAALAPANFSGEIIGAWDMEADFDVRSTGELYDILREMRAKFADLIHDVKVLNVIREIEVNPMAARAGIRVNPAKLPRLR